MEYAERSGYSYAKDPTLITKLVKGALYATLGAILIALIVTGMLALGLYQVPVDRYRLIAEARTMDVLRLVILGLYVITTIIFLRWVFVVDSNCHGFGAVGMTISPGWAAGWYFIPFANLVKPFQAMSEIRRVSTDPVNWLALRAGWLLALWWTFWLVTGSVNQFAWSAFDRVHSLSEFRTAVDWQVADRSIQAISFAIALMLVYDITRRQKNLVANGVRPASDSIDG